MKKFYSVLMVIGLAILATLAFSPTGAAQATEGDSFKPYETSQTWYAPLPATVESPFAVPQTTTVLECGGIKQFDQYTIDTPELEKAYLALIAGGVLKSPADDEPFHPRGVVTALPECAPVVIVPEKPAAIVTESTSTGEPDCTAKSYIVTTNVSTTDFTYDEKTNTWIKGEPVITTSSQTFPTTDIQCPAVIVPPVDKPEAPIVPVTDIPVVDEAPAAIVPVQTLEVSPAVAERVAAQAVPQSLAFTGTNENFQYAIIGSAVLAILAGVVLILARIKRGPVTTGVVE